MKIKKIIKILSFIWMCMKLNMCIREILLFIVVFYDYFLYLIVIIMFGLKVYVGYFILGLK